ncbi:hypothetical protein Syn7502_02184 [Synechococcus sp. PCC 7502]|uniref:DUF6671 family protein n=1 Tax=Synechococcus sp. PCC 7502 TaxID=1173263 RepID=UPI00029FF329|nr:DUF6671 family protein [Synechococcus sp. PCC 7502]AFY74193.1 hypothetical protein Syn7502_02184 [Synechococcus sp. PCC 7502]
MVSSNSPLNSIEFQDRLAVIATMHRKEIVIAPILETSLGLRIIVPQDFSQDFNSDLFGTFTRDIDRTNSQVQTAKLKAEKAMELLDVDLAIASEGSFFPHPFLGIPFNREIVLIRDRNYDFTVYGEFLSTDTNFNHQEVSSYQEAYEFALRAGFPNHGIVIMPDAHTSAKEAIYKGIISEEMLKKSVNELLKRSPQIHIETDMRALYNPTRMNNIAKATQVLVRKLQQLCPNCNFVNFDVAESIPGLPCELCGLPTQVTRSHIYGCDRCNFKQEILFPDGNQTSDPMYCSYCNP